MSALPQLDGVDFRMFRGPADYADFARIITASARGEGEDASRLPRESHPATNISTAAIRA